MKKTLVIFDPKNPGIAESIEVEEGVIQLIQHLSKLGNKSLPCGDVKKEALEILINNIRPEILELATYMETKLRLHDREKKDSWKGLTTKDCLERAEQELSEFSIAVEKKVPAGLALGEAADHMNFIMFAAINYKEGRG